MLVTKQAPAFKAQAVMPDNTFKEVSLSDYKGKKIVLFFYPLDFTFVWPSELINLWSSVAFNKVVVLNSRAKASTVCSTGLLDVWNKYPSGSNADA